MLDITDEVTFLQVPISLQVFLKSHNQHVYYIISVYSCVKMDRMDQDRLTDVGWHYTSINESEYNVLTQKCSLESRIFF